MTLWLVDYVLLVTVLGLPLVISLVIRWRDGKHRTPLHYLVGNGELRILPTSASMAVSFLSGPLILGGAAELYYYGVTFTFSMLGQALAIVTAAFLIVPLMYPLKLTSINQYLWQRYHSHTLVVLGWFQQVFGLILFNALGIVSSAVILQTVFGLNFIVSATLLAMLTTIYTTIGGFNSVIWTDVLQLFVIVGGLGLILIQAIWKTGSISTIFEAYSYGGRSKPNIHFSLFERMDVYGVTVAYFTFHLVAYGGCQLTTQRMCALSSQRAAKITVLLSCPIGIFTGALAMLCGVAIFGYYHTKGCDPLADGAINNPNQILPYFVMDALPYPGFRGLFASCVVCGMLSNLSSGLSGMAALTWSDLLEQRLKSLSTTKKRIITQLICVVCGAMCLLMSVCISSIKGSLIQILVASTNALSTGSTIIYICSPLIKRLNYKSVLVGTLIAMSLSGWIAIGGLYTRTHQTPLDLPLTNCSFSSSPINLSEDVTSVYMTQDGYVTTQHLMTTVTAAPVMTKSFLETMMSISYNWVNPMCSLIGVLICVLVSYIPGFSSDFVDEKLIYPFIRQRNISLDTKEDIEVPMITKMNTTC